MAIYFGRASNKDEIRFYLDQLTKIMEVCQLKSKNVNLNLLVDLKGCNEGQLKNIIPQQIEENQETCVKETKQIAVQNCNKQRRKYKPRKRNYRYKNK